MRVRRDWMAAGAALLVAGLRGEVARQPFPMDWTTHAETVADLSWALDAPAGKGGFIRVEGGRLVKPDGARLRIWGVNICGPACFPPKEEASALAERFARLGFNCVRFHHMDSPWGQIFGRDRDDTRALDTNTLDRFDFFVAELKRHGIYANLNLNVGRPSQPPGDVRNAYKLGPGKSFTFFNPRLIELQREFASQLLMHINPYTGNAYRDEPSVATVEIVNENSVLEGWLFWRLVGKDVDKPGTWTPIPVSYDEELTDLYNAWLNSSRSSETLAALRAEAGGGADGRVPRLKPSEFAKASVARFRTEAAFYIELEHRFFDEMRRFLKVELSVKPPVVGTADHNDGYAAYAHIEANAVFDVIDGHGYWQHPDVHSEIPSCKNTPMVNDPLDTTVTQFARTPVLGRAFTISEVNHPFPHESACEGFPILTAYAMFHDWDGIYWFTWGHSKPAEDGGIRKRDFFSITPDPVKMANLMACGALWHQGGIASAKKTVVRSYTREQMVDALRMERKERPFFTSGFDRTTPLRHATRFRFDGGAATAFPPAVPLGEIVSDTGELGWYGADRQQGLVTVDAPGAQALIGFVRDGKRATRHLAADVRNGFCSLLLVPLDRKPVTESSRLLLAATGWCGHGDMRWDDMRRKILDWGRGPTMIEPVTGLVMVRGLAGAKALHAHVLTAAGAPTGSRLPVAFARDGGGWAVTLGSPVATLVLIEVER